MGSKEGSADGVLGASNKPQTLPNSIIPFIDKLSVTFNIPHGHGPIFYQSLTAALSVTAIFQSAKNNSRYKFTRNISLSSCAERVLINAGPKHPGCPDCRLEFNPSKLGWQGVNDLDFVLLELFPGGWDYVWTHGQITRIDIAIDLPGVRVEDFHVLPHTSLTYKTYGRNGLCETIYIGKPKGNQFRIYDKTGEQKANGIKTTTQITRVEKILRVISISPSELHDLANPFSGLVLVAKTPLAPVNENPKAWAMFLDSVQVRGLGPALALLSKTRRTTYRKHIAAQSLPWWKPEEIWFNWKHTASDLK